ncbi:hypothetical protein AB4144_42350, partial [Rhizobiaceae sp. 2RAB30]
AFPNGGEEASTFMNRLVAPRNKLAHANPVSVREAEQVICYCHDVIESLKAFFAERNMDREYNAPTIVRISDSFGKTAHAGEIRRNGTGAGLVSWTESTLRAGVTLSLEVEVDESFHADFYRFDWVVPAYEGPSLVGRRITVNIVNRFVSPSFTVYCIVTSDQDWHRLGEHDDSVAIAYKVLPPAGR